MPTNSPYIRWFSDLTRHDVALVGGKNASLGEMLGTLSRRGQGCRDGFATTADAYRLYLEENRLADQLRTLLDAYHQNKASLAQTGAAIRRLLRRGRWPR